MAAIESPCVNLCTLDADGICEGCGRTIDEVALWGSYSPEERRAVMDTLPARRAEAERKRADAQR